MNPESGKLYLTDDVDDTRLPELGTNSPIM
jgi:hypothetical protein